MAQFDVDATKASLSDEIAKLLQERKTQQEALDQTNARIEELQGYLDALSGKPVRKGTRLKGRSNGAFTKERREVLSLTQKLRWAKPGEKATFKKKLEEAQQKLKSSKK